MAKRRKRVSGTRTKDEFPNFLTGFQSIGVGIIPTLFETVRISTPLPRLKTTGQRATVMELLWLEVFIPNLVNNLLTPLESTIIQWQFSIGSAPEAFNRFSDPRNFAEMSLTDTLLCLYFLISNSFSDPRTFAQGSLSNSVKDDRVVIPFVSLKLLFTLFCTHS